MKSFVKSHPVLAFFALTFLITWSLWAVIIGLKLPLSAGYVPFVVAAAGPSLTGLILSYIIGGSRAVKSLLAKGIVRRVELKWYATVLLLPIVLALGSLGLYVMLGHPWPPFAMFSKGYLLPLAFVQVLLLGGPLEEELGWRGFVLPHLQARFTALGASLIVGVMWALWHLPAYLIPWSSQHLPLVPYLLHFAALSVLFTWVYNHTQGSLLPVLVFHTSVNLFTAFLPVVPLAAGSPLPLNLMVGLLYVTAAVVVIVFGPAKLVRKPLEAAVNQA
jgi:membrane protease YdiL (CAAX protease family)